MNSPFRLAILFVVGVLCVVCCPLAHAGSEVPPVSSPSRESSGKSAAPGKTVAGASGSVTIPGPLRSFLRMASISQKAPLHDILALLARNVYTHGYQDKKRTEYLVLLTRYVDQAQELRDLAGADGVIRVSGCDQAEPLLRILGYRLEQGCGQSNTSLITHDPKRAFLTTDSGFPLAELEETLRGGKPFTYSFPATRVPVLFSEDDWRNITTHKRDSHSFVGDLLRDPALAHLYWGLAQIDAQTRDALRRSPGLHKLLPYGAGLDFYGSYICIRSGRVQVPGGTSADAAWKDLTGKSPASSGEFVLRLLAKDNGWLAAYFDALSRVSHAQQAHFTQAARLKRFYEAFRSADPSADAARPTFRPAPGLLLLLTRLQWEPTGEPHVPGNLAVWKEIFRQKHEEKFVRRWTKRADHWRDPEQLLEAMFAFSRLDTDSGPLQLYLTLSELDRVRPPQRRLTPETVLLLARQFDVLSDQYPMFSEFPELNNASITAFVNVADTLDKISNQTLRGNAIGIFQANLGLWQIMARQSEIAGAAQNSSWQAVIMPFAKVASAPQLFDAGRASLRALLRAATGKAIVSQNGIIELLAGPRQASSEDLLMHREEADRIRTVLQSQRLVSLDTVLALGRGLREMAGGATVGASLIPLAEQLREFEMPRPIFTSGERSEWAAGTYNNSHTESQMRTDLTKVIRSHPSPEQLEDARGQLAPFMRDTLVGLNYAYYEPPGAQVLHNNPLFVRSHDFSGETVVGMEHEAWRAPELFGEGSPAGGGAHLVGSLADLPYALAEVEQDFIVPENIQALIWRELVPGLLINAALPRWWEISAKEIHAVALYQRSGEELLTASVKDDGLRSKVLNILSDRMDPRRLDHVEQALRGGRVGELLPHMLPADTFYLTAEFRRKFPGEAASWGTAGRELDSLLRRYPDEAGWDRLSRDFGVSHQALARTNARELLNVGLFPAFQGYASRLMAESWDSSNLYWARLADEMGYSPIMLNRLMPQLARRMVEKIFATNFEDWPALLRAMRETGEEVREGKLASLAGANSRP
jgi:hypothetical protein